MVFEELKKLFEEGKPEGKWMIIIDDELVKVVEAESWEEACKYAKDSYPEVEIYESALDVCELDRLKIEGAVDGWHYWRWFEGYLEDEELKAKIEEFDIYPFIYVHKDKMVPVDC